MHSWCISNFGGPEQFWLNVEDVDLPAPGLNEVLIKTVAHSINPIDEKMLGGYGNSIMSKFRSFPIILGRDFVGEVLKNGNGVSKVNVGDKVWGVVPLNKKGALSTHIIVHQDHMTKKPEVLDAMEAACLPFAGLTAWSVLWSPSLGRNKPKVLVLGGSGGVGSIAVQMLKAWGCRVVTTCSTDAVTRLNSLGLHKVIDYKSNEYKQQVITNGPYDLIFNSAGIEGLPHEECLKKWSLAKYVTITHPMMKNADQFGLVLGMFKSLIEFVSANVYTLITKGAIVKWGMVTPCKEGMDALTLLANDGKIQPQIHKVFKFSEIPSAFNCQQEGHLRGKIVIQMDEDLLKTE
ncbi:reticulon-4-interacting protein 1 homolog, mitochondrial-like [Cloeon dipterum]|uniref:reticulon-4-interacting protein 1 homolog, mitochondrial-like n=1 Tax=Cloeon dipterum TaxID=197152 RepID=UPI003220198A